MLELRRMHRLLALFACVAVLFSLAGGSVAHAMEPIECVSVLGDAGIAVGHTEGDADQVPADGEKGYPHHHGGCHGHHIAAPLADAMTLGNRIQTSTASIGLGDRHVTSGGDPALRPPQA